MSYLNYLGHSGLGMFAGLYNTFLYLMSRLLMLAVAGALFNGYLNDFAPRQMTMIYIVGGWCVLIGLLFWLRHYTRFKIAERNYRNSLSNNQNG